MIDKNPGVRNSESSERPERRSSRPRYLVWFLLILLFSWYWYGIEQTRPPLNLSYTEFKARVRADQVAEATLRGDQVSGVLREDSSKKHTAAEERQPPPRFITTLPPIDDPELIPLLEKHGVNVSAESEQARWWQQALIGLIPWLFILAFLWYSARRMQENMTGGEGPGGLFGFGKSRAKRFRSGESRITFDDVAGLENAKRDMREITGYLKDPARYRKLGAYIPKGILLMGPPGTGKTLMAKAMAGEAGVPFFSISGSEFIEMFVGVGASRVRDLFESAKKEAPAVIFIDEIDSVGRARGAGLGGGHDEREQTLNQILGEMDGFDPHEAVVVLAATNRPDVLDAALLRPGRFDRKITLDLPDKKARLQILKIHSKAVPLTSDVDMERLAALTAGFAGADLENLVNEAALMAGREYKEQVDMALLLNARDKVVLGGKRELAIGDREKRLIAYHEAGHAVAASLLPHADPLDKVTVIPRGRALGATEQVPEEERHNLSESYLRDRIGVMLGGRVSEKMIFGEFSSGAENDLKEATRLARQMVSHWGMSDKLGPLAFHRGEEHVFLGREIAQPRDFSEYTARIIDGEIGALLRGIEKEIADLLRDYRPQLDALAEALLENETLEAAEIRAIIESKPAVAYRKAVQG